MLWSCLLLSQKLDRIPSQRRRCRPEDSFALQKKKMRSKVADEDALDLAALEAEAAAADSSRDRGSREERAAARDAAEREGLAAADEQRKARYDGS